MTDTSLKGTLAGSFSKDGSKDGFKLDVSIDGLGKLLKDVNPVLGTLDVTALHGALDLLNDADFSSIAKAVEDAADRAASLFDDLPDADRLLSGLEGALAELLAGIDADMGRTLKEIEAAAGRLAERLRAEAACAVDLDVSMGAARLAQILEALAGAASNPLLSLVLVAFARIAKAVLGGWNAIAGQGAGFAALVRSLGSLGGLEALSRQALTLSLALARPLQSGRLEATVGRLGVASADAGLAAAVTGIDPDDSLAVEAAAAPILAFSADIERLAELLDDAVGAGLEALRRADVPALVAAIEGRRDQVLGTGLAAVGRLATEVRTHLDPLLRVRPPALAAGQTGAVHVSAAMVRAARSVAGTDPARFAKPLTDGLDAALGPLHDVRVVVERATAAIETAVRAFAATAGSVDLSAVAETLRRALRPVADALDTVNDAVAAAQAEIKDVVGTLTTTITTVQGDITTAFGPILKAFEAVDGTLSTARLDQLVAGLRAAVEQVATVLRAAPLQPFIDTAVGVMNTGADILSAVPKDLLPSEVRAKLDEACREIQRIDFAGVTTTLADDLDEIVTSVGGAWLADITVLYDKLLGFLQEINPRPFVVEFEKDSFDPFLRRLKGVDPTELLAPVQEALDEVRATVKDLDPARILAPVEAVFDQLEKGFAELDPATLLAPLAADAAALRAQIHEALPVGDAIAALTRLDGWVASTLGALDPAKALTVLDAIYEGLVGGIRELACETGLLAGSVRGLLVGVDLDVPLASLGEGWRWVSGHDGAAVLSERVGLLAEAVDAALRGIDRYDVDALVGDLTRAHRAIVAEVAGHPGTSELRRRLDPVLARSDPTVLFAPLAGRRAGHRQVFAAAAAALRRLEGSSWSQVTVAADTLRAELRSLAAVPDRLGAWLDWLGADTSRDGLARAVDDVLAQFRPSLLMPPLVAELAELGTKVEAVVHDGLLAPVIAALRDAERLVDLIDVPVPKEELVELHRHLAAGLDALRPRVVLADALGAVEVTLHTLVAFDPLAGVRTIVSDMHKALAALVAEVRPTVLFEPVLGAYDRIVATAAGLDVGALLQPVFDALGDIERQLAAGLTDAGVALERLKDACRSPGGLSVGVKVRS